MTVSASCSSASASLSGCQLVSVEYQHGVSWCQPASLSRFDSVTSLYGCQQVLVGWIWLNRGACTCLVCRVVLRIRSPPQQVAQRSHSLEWMSILVSQCLWCDGDIRACAHLLSDRASQTHCLRAQGCSRNPDKRWRCFVCTVNGLANNGCGWEAPRMEYLTEHCKRHLVNPNNHTGQQPFMQTPQPAGQQAFVPTPQPAGQQPFVQTPPTVGQQRFRQTDGRVDGIAVSQATTEVTSCVAYYTGQQHVTQQHHFVQQQHVVHSSSSGGWLPHPQQWSGSAAGPSNSSYGFPQPPAITQPGPWPFRCGRAAAQDFNRRHRRCRAAPQARLLAVVDFHRLHRRVWAAPARLLAVVDVHNLHRLHRHRHHRPPARLPAVVEFHRLRRLSGAATCSHGNLWLSRIVTIRSALPVCRLVLAALCASCRGR